MTRHIPSPTQEPFLLLYFFVFECCWVIIMDVMIWWLMTQWIRLFYDEVEDTFKCYFYSVKLFFMVRVYNMRVIFFLLRFAACPSFHFSQVIMWNSCHCIAIAICWILMMRDDCSVCHIKNMCLACSIKYYILKNIPIFLATCWRYGSISLWHVFENWKICNTREQKLMHGNKKETGCYAISFSKNNTYQKPRSYSIQFWRNQNVDTHHYHH